MLKFIRLIAIFFALFLPGIYVAVTSYHHELLPTELLFTIEAARETVPFPVIFEILLMEISFELIREAGVRVPSPIGPTIGIVRWLNFRRSRSKCKFGKPYFNYYCSNNCNLFIQYPRLFFKFYNSYKQIYIYITGLYGWFFGNSCWYVYSDFLTLQP